MGKMATIMKIKVKKWTSINERRKIKPNEQGCGANLT
jgi:hypothetical protein